MTKAPVSASQVSGSPHYLGHRERLRERLKTAGGDSLADYEMLELILFRAIPRRDVKPLAKALLARFGSFPEVVAARPERLKEIEGISEAAIVEMKIVYEAAKRFAKTVVRDRHVLASFSAVFDYCRTAMAFLDHEEFRILFLDKKNVLIADEVQGVGTIDHAPVYPREIMRRALELNATAMVLVHNHPSGDPNPSGPDIQMTREIVTLGKSLNVLVHDHLIIGREGITSFKGLQLI
ncbi:MAG: JAB domain-containing protein [Beijerinckiaceae bacterium]|nr:MAG: JAB domain-containing protein [Beijerinckiaceae bacterium]